jgi:hypothetical protein
MTASIDYADKIDKLLRKAAGNDSEAEAEALREKAYAMMAKYSIDQAEIEARRRATGEQVTEKIVTKTIKVTGIFRYGLVVMSSQIIDALENIGVQAYMIDKQSAFVRQQNGSPKFREAIDFVVAGYESDVDQTVLLLTSLQMQAAAAMTTWWKNDPKHEYYARGLAFRSKRSFIEMFGVGAGQKIRLAQRRARATLSSGSGAEVAIRDKSRDVEEFLADKGLTVKAKRRKDGSWEARDSGYDAGQRANTGDPGVGRTERKAIT